MFGWLDGYFCKYLRPYVMTKRLIVSLKTWPSPFHSRLNQHAYQCLHCSGWALVGNGDNHSHHRQSVYGEHVSADTGV